MKAHGAELIALQALNVRKPSSRLFVHDTILRWTELRSDYYDIDFPSDTEIPSAFVDAMTGADDQVVWSWIGDTGMLSSNVATLSWIGSPVTSSFSTLTPHRCSADGSDTYFIFGSDIYVGASKVLTLSSLSTAEASAIAACSATSQHVALLQQNDESRYITFTHIHSGTARENYASFQVSIDYTNESLSWFDAIKLDNHTDLVMFQAETYGKPMVMKVYHNDTVTWASDPVPVIPIDVVDNYSFLRLGWLNRSGDVLIATGVLGREGSTGAYPQQWDIVLRSKDCEHWTMDRYQYLGSGGICSPLLFDSTGEHVYKLAKGYVYKAPNTKLFGLTEFGNDNLNLELRDDILSWGLQAGDRGNTTLVNPSGKYTNSLLSTYIRPGYQLERRVGFEHAIGTFENILSVEGLDSIRNNVNPGNKVAVLDSRPWASRQLADWASDQDWQWLSQEKLYDDCDVLDHLYSLTGTVPEVGLTGIDWAHYNEPMIMATTLAPTLNFYVVGNFSIRADQVSLLNLLGFREAGKTENDYGGWDSPISNNEIAEAEANAYTYTETLLGSGFGVFGCATDAYNLIAAFCDVANQKLYLLRRVGAANASAWTVLKSTNLSTALLKDVRYRVWLKRDGATFTYGVYCHTVSGDTVTTTSLGADSYVYTGATQLSEGHVGVLGNLRVPSTRTWHVAANSDFIARSWGNWLDAGDNGLQESNLTLDRFFEFNPSGRLHIEDEVMAIGYQTYSQYHGAFTYLTDVTIGTDEGWMKNHLVAIGDKSNSDTFNAMRIWPYYTALNGNVPGTIPGMGWLFVPIQGRGVGKVGLVYNAMIDGFNGIEIVKIAADEFVSKLSNTSVGWAIDLSPASNNFSELYDRTTYYALLPGFFVQACDEDGNYVGQRSVYGGKYHGPDSILLQHDNETITIHSVEAYNTEHDKNLDWVIKDIVAKAGILDIGGSVHYYDTDYAFAQCFSAQTIIANNVIDYDVTVRIDGANGVDSDLAHWNASAGVTTEVTGTGFSFYALPLEGNNLRYVTMTSDRTSVTAGNRYRVTFRAAALYGDVTDLRIPISGAVRWYTSGGEFISETLVDYITDETETVFTRDVIAPVSAAEAELIFYYTIVAANLLHDNAAGDMIGATVSGCGLYALNTSPVWGISLQSVLPTSDSLKLILDSDGSTLDMSLVQTKSGISATVETVSLAGAFYTNEIRIVKNERFLAVYIDGKWVHTFASQGITGTTGDRYLDTLWKSPATLVADATLQVTNPSVTLWAHDLWRRIDGVIMDQRQSALSGIQTAIRDARVLITDRPDGGLRIGLYDQRAGLGQISDVIFDESSSPTDRIPTHIRVSGAEISEYINHDAAAEYGVVFYLAQAESLDENEAYKEADRICKDALSYSAGRGLTFAAQSHWDINDEVIVAYSPPDGDAEVNDTMIVDSLSFNYEPADFTARATLRKKHE